MELLKELNVRKIGVNRRRYGLFYCQFCQKEVEKPMQDGRISKSCGCNRTRHGGTGTKIFSVWRSMTNRCDFKTNQNYMDYGGRGIKVCDEWRKFVNFRDWALSNGYCEGLTIDRTDNDKGYSPDNCRFVTMAENSRNRRSTKLDWGKVAEIRKLILQKDLSYRLIAKRYGIAKSTITSIARNRMWKEGSV